MAMVLVMLGGAIGAIMRFLVSVSFSSVQDGFPFATLFANITGCFLLGYLTIICTLPFKNNQSIKLFLGTGLLGSFTTFSTFSYETMELMKSGQSLLVVIYLVLSIVGGLILAGLGTRFGQWHHQKMRGAK